MDSEGRGSTLDQKFKSLHGNAKQKKKLWLIRKKNAGAASLNLAAAPYRGRKQGFGPRKFQGRF